MSAPVWKNPLVKWVDSRLPVFTLMKHSAVDYPTPKNLNYWWNFGSLAMFILVVMVLTGIFLVMNYVPNATMAFNSVERIMRDVNYGWLIRYMHMNGASMFFLLVYTHMFRGMYFGSYKAPRELLWIIGVFIILAMMATAFMGYVLPWGQMSFWGATVITNLFSAFPVVGHAIVQWLWGGFAVGNPTLNRFFSLHYLLPFVILALVVVHVWALHTVKSNNPLGVDPKGDQDTIPFHPYYTIKDLFGIGVFLMIYMAFVFWAPNFFGEPDNYIPANPMVTPPHIVPEWYFLPFYAILRSFTGDFWFYQWFLHWFMTAKLAGVLAMFASVLLLCFLPWLDRSKVKSAKFRPIYKQIFWLFVLDCIILGWVGAHEPQQVVLGSIHVVTIGQWASLFYFGFLLVIVPLVGIFERPRALPESISAAVTKSGKE